MAHFIIAMIQYLRPEGGASSTLNEVRAAIKRADRHIGVAEHIHGGHFIFDSRQGTEEATNLEMLRSKTTNHDLV